MTQNNKNTLVAGLVVGAVGALSAILGFGVKTAGDAIVKNYVSKHPELPEEPAPVQTAEAVDIATTEVPVTEEV